MFITRKISAIFLFLSIVLSSVLIMSVPSQAGTCGSSKCIGISPWTATSASQADVNYCVNTCAARGDTVNVPTGSATWTTDNECNDGYNHALCVSKGIHLKGTGVGSTVISRTATSPYDSIVLYSPDATAITNNETFELTGFTFDGLDSYFPLGAVKISIATSTASISNIIIHHNKFQRVQAAGSTGIFLYGNVFGVAYLNEFDKVNAAWRPQGADYVSWSNLTQVYGSVNNFYFEDNYIHFSGACTNGCNSGGTESGGGGRFVMRYNTWDVTNARMDSLWDIHGLQSMEHAGGGECQGNPPCDPTRKKCQQYSTMVAETYGNVVKGYASAPEWFNTRGGWSLYFNNTWSGTGTPSAHYAQYSCDSCASSGSYVQHISNTYVWNNFINASRRATLTKNLDMCHDAIGTPYTITEDVDYFNDKYSTFNGTSGVGCGTLANRPTTCTTGVGYWATNQSCTDMAGFVGDKTNHPSRSNISGTLYKCTSTNTWTPYYTPYTYPHPLRATSSGSVGRVFIGGDVGGGGGYAVDTATYGSRLDTHVYVLRDFRDRHSLTTPMGKAFVNIYY